RQADWQRAVALLSRLRALITEDRGTASESLPGADREAATQSLVAAIGACGRAQLWQVALRLLADTEAEATAWKIPRPDQTAVDAAASACAKGPWTRALDLFLRARQDGLRPSIISCNIAATRFQHWKEEMRRTGSWQLHCATLCLEKMVLR
ncbi:unnamed protein product, partial [Polarella glacialis]